MIIKNSFLVTVVCVTSFFQSALAQHQLHDLFNDPQQRVAIASFVDNVLRQMPSQQFMTLVDEVLGKGEQLMPLRLDDAQLYEKMRLAVTSTKSRFSFFKVIQLLNFQKQLLGKQVKQLLGEKPVIQNCLEIGTPGTYSSTIREFIKNKIYVVNDEQRTTDFIQSPSMRNAIHGFKGYDVFVPLNNYEPLSSTITDNSIDCIVCFIGLHHIPTDKLDAFVASLKRVLRPGGVFLLRDHNAYSPETVGLAFAAHSIFNAMIPGESVETEMREIRNFKPLTYWVELLERNGFTVAQDRLLQEGDTTLNTMIKCTKRCETAADCEMLSIAQAHSQSDYHRDGAQTYLTTPEWNNVDASQHYGKFIERIPFYEYPYMAQVKAFWQTFARSWRCAAQEKGGNLKLLLSPNILMNYTLMNLFVGVSMTAEYSCKALISWPVRKALSGVEATTLLALVHDPHNELMNIDSSVVVREQYAGDIKLVAIPRYIEFMGFVKKLGDSSVSFIRIAGNDHIACKIRYKNMSVPVSKDAWKQRFSWQMPTQQEYTYAVYSVPVKELSDFIKTMTLQNSELLYIHDF